MEVVKINNTDNKKAFDPTVCFMFFGSWLKVIEELETEQDRNSNAYSLFKAIAEYSMYDIEPDFSEHSTLKAFWGIFEKEIDISITRRKRGFAQDEMNEKYQAIITAIANNPNASLRAIADQTNTSKDMVSRVKRKHRKEIEETIDSVVCVSDNIGDSPDTVTDDNAIYFDIDTDNDSIRHDTDETVRHYNYDDDDDLPF